MGQVYKLVQLLRSLLRENLVGAVGNEVSAETEESPLLETVTRERLVKTQQTENA
jgi:hypothetical protein